MKRLDIRLKTVLLTLMLVSAVALTVSFWPHTNQPQLAKDTALPANSDVTVQFNAAVKTLRERQYRQAIEGFRAVLKQAPSMPEAYANIGFAHIELKQYELAKQAFNTTLELRPGQINAYWGLAVSLEGLCDIAPAIGAMKTFVHLAKQDNPHLKKANAALWEWGQLKKTSELDAKNKIACP